MDNQKEILKKNPLVLIVDDIPKNLQILSNILNTEGYQISFASNGLQALSVCEATKPDLILLDIMMPEMDGFEVCQRLKSNDTTKYIPIIFITGKAEMDDIVHGFKLGAVDYVTKPFNAIELISRVRNHIELKLSRDVIVQYNHQLKSTQDELKQTIASKDKFFSIIAHDLRGPFSGFLGLSELLADEYEMLAKEEISQIATSMNKAAKRLFNFLENLLDWSRAQMGRMDYNPFVFELSDLVDRYIGLLQTTAAEKNIKLINEVPDQTSVFADNNMLGTILRNLLSNAIKFTNNGGEVRVGIEGETEGLYKVSVTDNGIGMTQEALEKIFRIDTKFTTPGTNNETGTGLGLVLCKELVDMHGGKIEVFSEKKVGTKFVFTIPNARKKFADIEKSE